MRVATHPAVVMRVDPKFSRTSARSDFHVPLRSGTDIAFLASRRLARVGQAYPIAMLADPDDVRVIYLLPDAPMKIYRFSVA
jgi:hypothetical protein